MFNIFFDKIVKICHWEETNLGSDKTFWLPPSPASTITSTSAAAAASSLAHKSCFAILSCLQKCCWVSYCFVPFVKLGNLAFLRWQIVLNAVKAEYGFWGLLKVTDSGKKVLWNAVPGFISLWSLFLSLSLSLYLYLSSFPVLLYYVYWCRYMQSCSPNKIFLVSLMSRTCRKKMIRYETKIFKTSCCHISALPRKNRGPNNFSEWLKIKSKAEETEIGIECQYYRQRN